MGERRCCYGFVSFQVIGRQTGGLLCEGGGCNEREKGVCRVSGGWWLGFLVFMEVGC